VPRQNTIAGLLETYTDAEGQQQAMRLTPGGERVARQLAMAGEDDQDALLAALLDDAEAWKEGRPLRGEPFAAKSSEVARERRSRRR
jgi:hypothetical protein